MHAVKLSRPNRRSPRIRAGLTHRPCESWSRSTLSGVCELKMQDRMLYLFGVMINNTATLHQSLLVTWCAVVRLRRLARARARRGVGGAQSCSSDSTRGQRRATQPTTLQWRIVDLRSTIVISPSTVVCTCSSSTSKLQKSSKLQMASQTTRTRCGGERSDHAGSIDLRLWADATTWQTSSRGQKYVFLPSPSVRQPGGSRPGVGHHRVHRDACGSSLAPLARRKARLFHPELDLARFLYRILIADIDTVQGA